MTAPISMRARLPSEPPQKPAQAGATPGVVGMVLPCPFCGATPRLVTVPSGRFYGCQTPTCLAEGGLHPINAWNIRTPISVTAVDAIVHDRVYEALQAITTMLMGRYTSGGDVPWKRLEFAYRKLCEALDARRPPPSPAPPSVAFWLGAEDDAP